MTETSPKAPKASRLTRGLLIGSLALNFLIIGGTAGFLLTAGKHRQPPQASFNIGAFTRALEGEQRQDVREKLSARMEFRRKSDRKEGRRAMRALMTSLQQVPFNRANVLMVLDDIEGQSQARRAQGTEALIDAIEAMTPAERAEYVTRLQRDLRKHHGSKKRPAEN